MCPYCRSPFSRVIATERNETLIRRRRVCSDCGGKYFTQETFDGLIAPPPDQSWGRPSPPSGDAGG